MSKAVIMRVVYCEGTRFGDVFCVYYASGRTHEWYNEHPSKAVCDWMKARSKVTDTINRHGKRYICWE